MFGKLLDFRMEIAMKRKRNVSKRVLFSCLLFSLQCLSSGQIRYSIPEEMELNSVVGNIVQDLGINVGQLLDLKLRITSAAAKKQYFKINPDNGELYVGDRIDREEICGSVSPCLMNFKVVVENPLSVYRAEIEIKDINDNAPTFSTNSMSLVISETISPGMRFPLGTANDPDLDINALQGYTLSSSDYFSLDIKTDSGGSIYAELVLEQELDYEKERYYILILTATDGGKPPRSGAVHINVTVQDVNDNMPVFGQDVYKVSLKENSSKDTLVVKVTATDADSGSNGNITYTMSKTAYKVNQIFKLDSETGEIRLEGPLDFEERNRYEMQIDAKDGGDLTSHCKVIVDVLDHNDNAPELIISSVSSHIPEDSLPGTKVAILDVLDQDSGENGEVYCNIQEISPFKLIPSFENYYILVTNSMLDREQVSEYNITIVATDKGLPPLSTSRTIRLQISDINDNSPRFSQTFYAIYVTENNLPGSVLSSVEAKDLDSNEYGRVTYSLHNGNVGEFPVSAYVSINSATGNIYALRSFDYEEFRALQMYVQAEDGGIPPLKSNTTVKICITDRNDNTPEILYPPVKYNEFSGGFEIAPRTSDVGYLVTKVIATDADSGQNAWLSYQLLKATESSLFSIGYHTGEIRTSRVILDNDSFKQTVVIFVKDNGEPSLSCTVTLTVFLADDIPEIISDFNSISSQSRNVSNLTIYLVISVVSVSILFIGFIMIVFVVKFRRWRGSRLCKNSNANFSVIPTSTFVYMEKARSLPQTYSYEICSTADSRKNNCLFPQPYLESTLACNTSTEKREANLLEEKLIGDKTESYAFTEIKQGRF